MPEDQDGCTLIDDNDLADLRRRNILAGARIAELEAALIKIRDLLPIVNDAYARRVFFIAAEAAEPLERVVAGDIVQTEK